jgi:hypothetical protein
MSMDNSPSVMGIMGRSFLLGCAAAGLGALNTAHTVYAQAQREEKWATLLYHQEQEKRRRRIDMIPSRLPILYDIAKNESQESVQNIPIYMHADKAFAHPSSHIHRPRPQQQHLR